MARLRRKHCHGQAKRPHHRAARRELSPPPIIVRMYPRIGRDLALVRELDQCTDGEYRGVRHDRHFSAASSFQIGVSRGLRIASSDRLARVLQRRHSTSSQP
jgi:hypothetical protein